MERYRNKPLICGQLGEGTDHNLIEAPWHKLDLVKYPGQTSWHKLDLVKDPSQTSCLKLYQYCQFIKSINWLS